MEHVRIDKWLWAARFFKTRGAATEAVVGGRVHVNGVRVKPAKDVRPGDTVEVTIGALRWTVAVTGVTDKRGPASVARTLYDETPESAAAREQRVQELRLARRPGRATDEAGAPPSRRSAPLETHLGASLVERAYQASSPICLRPSSVRSWTVARSG
jgi:ribosome-associated heat shock protein Hsp15